jgi:pyridoxine/pyridoxamine 5'-phosphate oxidase
LKNQYLEEAKRELINGHAKGHPFRYFVLATNENGKPRQRTVVLVKTLLDLSLVIYTDKELKKIKIFKIILNLAPYFMILKNYYKFGSGKPN